MAGAIFAISSSSIMAVNIPAGLYTNWMQLPTGYLSGLEIAANQTVIIKNIPIGFNSNAAITVAAGGKLTLDGVEFYCGSNGNLWAGVTGNGISAQSHYSTDPTYNTVSKTFTSGVINSSQTQINIINNSTIRNATCGVKSLTGAILDVAGSTFEDCIGYVNIVDNLATSPPHPAHSIKDCTFKMPYANLMLFNDIKMIDLLYIDMVTIGGCTFINSHVNNPNNIVCPDKRCIAINADKSTFSVTKNGSFGCKPNDCIEFCGTTGCTFTGFYKAINVNNPTTPQKGGVVLNATFANNFYGIYSAQSSGLFIRENTFNGNRTTINSYTNEVCWISASDPVYGIYYTNTEKLSIVDNTFDFTGTNIRYIAAHSAGNGFVEIKANRINNASATTVASDNVTGIDIQGIGGNTKTNITCNKFTNMGTDIYAGSKLADFETIDNEAANEFSDQLSGRGRINSPNATQNYYVQIFPPAAFNPLINSVGVIASQSNGAGLCTIGCSEYYVENLINTLNTNTSIPFVANQYNISVYPNPSTGIFNVKTDYDKAFTITVYDISGRTIINQLSSDAVSIIDLSAHKAGVYFIKIEEGVNTYTAKI